MEIKPIQRLAELDKNRLYLQISAETLNELQSKLEKIYPDYDPGVCLQFGKRIFVPLPGKPSRV